MKKRIAVMAINREIRTEYVEQMQAVLGDIVEIEPYAMQAGKPLPEADMLIVLSRLAVIMAESLYGDIPLYCIKTTFSNEGLDKLQKIPPGTRALLVSYESPYIVECMDLLAALGVRHIKWIPYWKGLGETVLEDVDTAVFMGIRFEMPPCIKHTIDIGWRKITPESYLEIFHEVKINASPYFEQFVQLKQQLPPAYSNAVIGRVMEKRFSIENIRMILNALPSGVVVIDANRRLFTYNTAVCALFGVSKDQLTGLHVSDFPPLRHVYETASAMSSESCVCIRDEASGKDLAVSVKTISFFGEKYLDILFIDEFPLEKPGKSLPARRRNTLRAKYTFDQIVGPSEPLRRVIRYARMYAKTSMPILITGETGTGKELFAQAIHNASDRRDGPFIAVNCAAIPEELLESELFGYEKGSFTGALESGKKGLFEAANGGTLFLDEIGDSRKQFQVKLLRALQEQEIIRVGSCQSVPVDVRVIAATHAPVEDFEKNGALRKDLFFRLAACLLPLPPLRERTEDIMPIVRYYLDAIGAGHKKPDRALETFLVRSRWEGNIRELRNCAEYLGMFGGDVLVPSDLPPLYHARALQAAPDAAPARTPGGALLADVSEEETAVCLAALALMASEGCGRRKLHERLLQDGISVSEYALRRLLDGLEQHGFIEKRVGRNGTFVTETGRALLKANT